MGYTDTSWTSFFCGTLRGEPLSLLPPPVSQQPPSTLITQGPGLPALPPLPS